MPAAAVRRGDPADVDRALGAHAHAPLLGRLGLFEERHRPHVLHREREVDEAFGVVVAAVSGRRHLRRDREQRNLPGGVHDHARQHAPEEAHARHAVAVVVGTRDPGRLRTGFHAARRDVERARRDVREVEGAGVGQDREVDVRGDVGGERRAECQHERIHQLAARRRGFVHPVDGAVARVAGVMVDVDDRRAVEARHARAREIAALHDDRRIEHVVHMARDPQAVHGGEGLQVGRRHVAHHHARVLAERAQREHERHAGADRITIRTLV